MLKDVGGREGKGDLIQSKRLVDNIIDQLKINNDLIVISPDTGRSSWVQALAKNNQLLYEVLIKDRPDSDEVVVGSASSRLQNKTALIFDDMIRTGGTAIEAAKSCIEAGAIKVVMIATHAVLPEGAEKRINESSISEVHVTNTHSNSQKINSDKFTVHSIVGTIADEIKQYF